MEVDPPHWAARGVAYVLMLLFATAAVAAVIVHVPETVSAPFMLVPVRGTDPVRTSHQGFVTDVRVAEGQSVTAGQPLFVIRSESVADRSTELRTLEAQERGTHQSLVNARAQYESQRRADDREIRKLALRVGSLAGIIEVKKSQLATSRERAERYRQAYEREVTSWEEYSQAQLEADNLSVELQQLESERAEAAASIEGLRMASAARRAEYAEIERGLAEAIERGQIRMSVLGKDVVLASGSELVVPAPCAGTVLRLQVQNPGAVVQEGDVLGEVGCSGSRIQAQLRVPQKGVALLKPGQHVKLLYDAFPYQRYGIKTGRVRWISPAGLAGPDSAAFRALVDLDETTIRVRGQPRSLAPGMGGTALVQTGRRSLISYAFEPVRQLRSTLADTPESAADRELPTDAPPAGTSPAPPSPATSPER